MPPPGSGVLTAYILNILDGHLYGDKHLRASRDPKIYHRIVEAFKHAYAWRTKLADPKFVVEVGEVSMKTKDCRNSVESSYEINSLIFYFTFHLNSSWQEICRRKRWPPKRTPKSTIHLHPTIRNSTAPLPTIQTTKALRTCPFWMAPAWLSPSRPLSTWGTVYSVHVQLSKIKFRLFRIATRWRY